MAVVNTKSGLVTNADASPRVLTQGHVVGTPRFSVGLVEVAAADDDTSVYRMLRMRSSDRIDRLLLLNDAITGGTSYDLGVYETAMNGGAAVDVDLFASAISMASARTEPLDVTHENLNIDQCTKQLWELLGLTADPVKEYDIAFTANTVGSAPGTIALKSSTVFASA